MARWAMMAGAFYIASHGLERHGPQIVTPLARLAWGEPAAAAPEGQKSIRQIAYLSTEGTFWACGVFLFLGAVIGRDRV
jgi:hypothetical protein